METNKAAKQGKPPKGKSKFRRESRAKKPSDRLWRDDDAAPDASDQVDPKPEDAKKAARDDRKYNKSKLRMDKSADKLDAAKDKLAKQKPPKKPGAVKKLSGAAGREIHAKVHGKIHEVERDNVGVEAAHRIELTGERAGRSLIRFVKRRNRTHPARRVRKREKKNIKARADYQFRTLARDNPEIKSNTINRFIQKRRLRKQYRKQAREAARKTGGRVASAVERTGRAAVAFVKRNPSSALLIGMCFLLLMVIQSCMGAAFTIGNGLGGSAGATTYASEDAEMLGAEAAYAGMEADLQYELDNYAGIHSSYDEYHFDLDEIGHDPYSLISIISAWHEGAWTLAGAESMLTMLFERQYTLTENVVTEVRYRTETSSYTDPVTGATTTDTYEVPYNYYICYVTLDNFNLSHLPVYMMGEEQLSRYAMYMSTLGNRPDLFAGYPGASALQEYTDYDIPSEYLDDETFAAIITEAEKYLGFPYIWGGSSPQTSFDCSGFVSWVINHSGWNAGRLGAQGLYNICTPVSASEAKPGDLVFFVGTYDTPGMSHCGIYVGDGMMIHCGDPISYASINTAYWQSHFAAFGRLP